MKKKEIDADLGIRIIYKNKEFSLDVDNNNRLILRSIDDISLLILPLSSNTVEIRSE